MKNIEIFDNLKEGDKIEYEYWYDEIKKGEDTATVEREAGTSLSNEVWVSDCRHENGAIWEKHNDHIGERTKDGETDYDIVIKKVEPSEQRIKDLEQKTNLSNREAELYVLTEELGYNTVQASKLMRISKNNAYGKRGDIKEKIEKAEKTAQLEI